MEEDVKTDPEHCRHHTHLKWSSWGMHEDGKWSDYLLCQNCKGYYVVLEPDGTYRYHMSPWHPANIKK